jgi:cell division protein FtsB
MPQIIMTKSRVSLVKQKPRRSGINPSVNIVIPVILNLLLLSFSVLMLYNLGKSLVIANQKLEILKSAQVEVTSLRLENIKLVMQENEVINHDYIESEARNRLNYAKAGEVQYVIPDSLVERYKSEAVLGAKTVDLQPKDLSSRVTKWVEFLFNGI